MFGVATCHDLAITCLDLQLQHIFCYKSMVNCWSTLCIGCCDASVCVMCSPQVLMFLVCWSTYQGAQLVPVLLLAICCKTSVTMA